MTHFQALSVATLLLSVGLPFRAELGSSHALSRALPSECPPTTHVQIREDEDDPAVWAIANSFEKSPSRSNTKKAFEILEQKLSDWGSHPVGVVTTILHAIGDHGVKSGRPYLVRYLKVDPRRTSAAFVASVAALALGDLGGPGAFEALKQAGDHRSDESVSSVAVALGVLHDPRSVPVLEDLLQRADSNVRHRALSALASYCAASSRPLALHALDDTDPRVRNGATWWLLTCGTEEDASYLSERLSDPEELVRSNALKGLVKLKNKVGCPSLARLLADPSLTVREQAEAYRLVCESS